MVGALRTNWVVVLMLGLLAVELALLAVGSMMVGSGQGAGLSTAGSGLGFVVSGLACGWIFDFPRPFDFFRVALPTKKERKKQE